MRSLFLYTLLIFVSVIVKGQVEDDMKFVVKLAFDNTNIISLELKEKIQLDSIIHVGHSGELLNKDHYEIVMDDKIYICINGIDYIFFHQIENWLRIYDIDYTPTSIVFMIDVIINDLVYKNGTLSFIKTKGGDWDVDNVKIKKGSMDNIWDTPEFY